MSGNEKEKDKWVVIKHVWQVIQCVAAIVCKKFLKAQRLSDINFEFSDESLKEKIFSRVRIYSFESKTIGSFSLGLFIFLNTEQMDEETLRHEWGHSKQSFIMGPFYILIMIISPIFAWLSWKNKWIYDNYYNLPWEKWADRLGGVTKSHSVKMWCR